MNTQEQKEKISKEIAIQELKDFFNFHDDGDIEKVDVEKDKPLMLKCLMEGRIVIDENKDITLNLLKAIKNQKEEDVVNVLNFKTRIKPSDARNIAKGMDLKKDSLGYVQKCMVHLLTINDVNGERFPVNELFLDKLSKFDYRVVEEITQTFL